MIVVVADDLTGAAEIAGAARRYGLTAEVHIDQLLPSDADVRVVDANSRSCPSSIAAAKVSQIAQQALMQQPTLIFKKVDSVLRGPVAAELTAMKDTLGASQVLMVNANPRKGRTVTNGCLSIDGRPLQSTAFACDPEHPRTTSQIVELLSLTELQVAFVSPGERLPQQEICVGLAEQELDLLAHAQAWQRSELRANPSDRILLAGGGEFFEAVLKTLVASPPMGSRTAALSVLKIEPNTVLIAGSSNRSDTDWPSVLTQLDSKRGATIATVRRNLLRYGRVALVGTTEHCDAESRMTRFIAAAHEVLVNCRPQHLWIEGGRTASQLVRELGYQRLNTMAVHSDGVVRLAVIGQAAPSLVLKPGSYNWPITFTPPQATAEIA